MDDEKSMGKLVLIGDSGVGKTSMFSRFFDKKFTENTLPTLGVEYKIRNLEIDGKYLKLMIWDTSGQEKYNSIAKNFYQASHGMLVVFSLTDRDSFDHIDHWLERVKNDAPKEVCIMLVGNKSDDRENRKVDFDLIKNKAKALKVPYVETSAKDGNNVNEAFMEMAKMILKTILESGKKEEGRLLRGNHAAPQGNSSCPC